MIVERAFLELYPQSKLGEYSFALTYSGKFNAYNGNVKQRGRHISFALSSLWKGIDESIQIGLIQILFNKLFQQFLKKKLSPDERVITKLYEVSQFTRMLPFKKTIAKNKMILFPIIRHIDP